MKRTSFRLRLCAALLAMNLLFIWGNSLLPGEVSGAFSDWVKSVLSRIFAGSEDDVSGGGLLRKLAHFSEFALLGACFCWLYAMLMTTQPRQLLFASISGILAACVDETIQRFVPLRNGCLTDVGIDTAGVFTGIVLFSIVYLINKHKQHLEEMK